MEDLNKMYGMRPADLDKSSRIIFPISFVIFQFLYWIIFGILSVEETEDLIPLDSF
jgi:hypothetical protein